MTGWSRLWITCMGNIRARRVNRRDSNEPAIVKALRDAGVKVYSELPVDLLIVHQGRLVAIEVKNPETGYPVSDGQQDFLDRTPKSSGVVTTPTEALELVRKLA